MAVGLGVGRVGVVAGLVTTFAAMWAVFGWWGWAALGLACYCLFGYFG